MKKNLKPTTPIPPCAQRKIKDWWSQNRATLLLPPAYAGHEHAWHTLDLDCAVCTICGIPHVCKYPNNIISCTPVEDNHETVCMITGIVLQQTTMYDGSMSVDEYQKQDAGRQAAATTDRHAESQGTDVLLKKTWEAIDLLLYSGMADDTFVHEQQRFRQKTLSAVQTYFSNERSQCQSCNAAGAVEFCLASIGNVRTPDRSLLPPRAHWTRLVHSIVLLINSIPEFRAQNLSMGSSTSHKIQQTIVGLLYVAPHGITIEGNVYLVAEPILETLLPLQIVLQKKFGLHSKIITETENAIKTFLKEGATKAYDEYLLAKNKAGEVCALTRGQGKCTCCV